MAHHVSPACVIILSIVHRSWTQDVPESGKAFPFESSLMWDTKLPCNWHPATIPRRDFKASPKNRAETRVSGVLPAFPAIDPIETGNAKFGLSNQDYFKNFPRLSRHFLGRKAEASYWLCK